MKRLRFFGIIILLTGIYFIVAGQKMYILPSNQKESKEIKDHIKYLAQTGLYDSAISYCAWLRKEDKLNYDNLEQALATIYYYKGDKHTAYQYILNQTDYNWKVYTYDAFSEALFDYEYAYPIASDTFLEKMCIDKVRDYYLQQDFPEAAAGYKLILLQYNFKKKEARINYELTLEQDKGKQQILETALKESRKDAAKQLLDILNEHGGFYTWREAGNGFRVQESFAAEYKDSTFHAALKPFYEKSFRAGKISQENFVEELMLTSGIPESDTIKYGLVKDSLCKIYKCRPMVRNVTYFKNGDSMVTYDLADQRIITYPNRK